MRDLPQPLTLNSQSAESGIKKYSCWCPKVIAMIGEAPDTIADRSIVVKLVRKLTTETCAPLSGLNTAEIKSQCVRFALDAHDSIAQCPKIIGEGLNDRAADTFDPLFVIARLAGPEWEQKLRAAALALAQVADSGQSGAGLILDILDIMIESGREKMFTRDLVARLRDGRGNTPGLKYSEISEHQISKILRPYGVKPLCLRIGKEVRNGYAGADFREALKRYISAEDVHARMHALRHRAQLREEARAEIQKEQALINQMLASGARGPLITVPEAVAKLRELTKDQLNEETSMPVNESVDT